MIRDPRRAPLPPPGRMPLSTRKCPVCRTRLAQALVDMGETYHIGCKPEGAK